jgi:NAD(P)-dependent dehydrogenase (short-subunit alcohol dehydrogenase family)
MLAGKAVVVTGAGAGLGRAYALAAAAHGAAVVVNDVDSSAADAVVESIERAGGRALAVAGSVAEWDVAARLARECVDAFGALDGLVANAGIMRTAAPWDETEEALRAIAEVNILGVQFTVRHATRAMVEQGRGGSIVTVVSGAQGGIPGMSAYGASKGAVAGMTANWALEGREHGIRVNAISPLAETAMALADRRADRPALPAAELVAPLVVALLADATAPLSGAILRFDGTALSEHRSTLLPLAQRAAWSAAELAAALGSTRRR